MPSFPNIFIILCYGLATLLLVGTFRGNISLTDYFLLEQKKNQLTERVSTLEQEIDHINFEMSKIEHSKAYAKKILKDRYSILDQNEEVIIVNE